MASLKQFVLARLSSPQALRLFGSDSLPEDRFQKVGSCNHAVVSQNVQRVDDVLLLLPARRRGMPAHSAGVHGTHIQQDVCAVDTGPGPMTAARTVCVPDLAKSTLVPVLSLLNPRCLRSRGWIFSMLRTQSTTSALLTERFCRLQARLKLRFPWSRGPTSACFGDEKLQLLVALTLLQRVQQRGDLLQLQVGQQLAMLQPGQVFSNGRGHFTTAEVARNSRELMQLSPD